MKIKNLVFLLSIVSAFAKEVPKYPVSQIPSELLNEVNAVVREDFATYTINSINKTTFNVHYVVTILNEKAKSFASMTLGYDKLSKINSLKGASYNAEGELIKKIKTSDIYDQSAYDGFSLYSDNRLKHASLANGSYPYTVEFEYELETKYLFMINGARLLPGENVSIQKFSYTLNYPNDLTPRTKTFNFPNEPEIKLLSENTSSKVWTAKNIMPIKFEPYGPSSYDLIPKILAAPSKFEYDGYQGSMDTWEGFGRWISSLNNGRRNLSEETKLKIMELTKGTTSVEQKVKILYEYLQNKTRYVSIQLGIGGFQPFEASQVDENGYGDCKALSNYMVSLLDCIGIKSHYTLIRAGDDEPNINVDFPSSQFNHVVVNVPNGQDTLWLECTSQTNPFGYMGSFTGNRNALAITKEGGKIVRTPEYAEKENLQLRKAEVFVDVSGDARTKVRTIYVGEQSERPASLLDVELSEQRKWIQRNIAIPSFEINAFEVTSKNEIIPSASINLDLNLRRYASVSGKRMFLTPNLMNRNSFVPEMIENRRTKIVKRFAFTDVDSIVFKIPDTLYPEFLPLPVRVTSTFGEYESNIVIEPGKVLYVRKVKMNNGEFPPESYNELIDFYKSINKADHVKIVFLNKT